MSRVGLRMHSLQHNAPQEEEGLLKCDQCPKLLKSKMALRYHMEKEHPEGADVEVSGSQCQKW